MFSPSYFPYLFFSIHCVEMQYFCKPFQPYFWIWLAFKFSKSEKNAKDYGKIRKLCERENVAAIIIQSHVM